VTELHDLVEIAAIKELKARYFRLVDTKQWEAWRLLFTDDARFEGMTCPGPADAFVEVVSRNLADATTVHHGHMPEIRLTGSRTARGIWAMSDYVVWGSGPVPGGGEGPWAALDGQWGIVGYGHYEEEYRKEGDDWRISFLRLTRLRVDPLIGDQVAPLGIRVRAAEDWLRG
jgi:hypothetical protein